MLPSHACSPLRHLPWLAFGFLWSLVALVGKTFNPPPPPAGQRIASTCPQCGLGNLGSTKGEEILSLDPRPPQKGYPAATGVRALTL